MPRSARHKSHRPHKHVSKDERDRSDSDDGRSPRDARQQAAEEKDASSRARVSRDPEAAEKLKSSVKEEAAGPGEGDSGERRKKRKERPENTERFDGGVEDHKREVSGHLDVEKGGKSKALHADSASKHRKREGSVDRNEESAGKRKLAKESSRNDGSGHNKDSKDRDHHHEHRSGEDLGRRESIGQYKDSKERVREKRIEGDSSRHDSHQYTESKEREKGRRTEGDSHRSATSGTESRRHSGGGDDYKDSKERDRERRSERDDRKAHERPVDGVSRKEDGFKEERKDRDVTEWKHDNEPYSPVLIKEAEKHSRRRDSSREKDKRPGGSRDVDDRRVSLRDDRAKNGSYRDERHREGRYREREKHGEDHDRDRRYHDEKYCDEHSSRDRAADRTDSKYYREENKHSENRHKRSKPHDGDPDGSSYVDDRGTKYRDATGRKRSSDEKAEDYNDLKHRNPKEPRSDREKTTSSAGKLESHSDGSKLDNTGLGKVDSEFKNVQPKGSSPGSHGFAEQSRQSSKYDESTYKRSPSREKLHSNSALAGDHASFPGARQKDFDSRSSEKMKTKDNTSSLDLPVEPTSSSRYNRTPRSGAHASPGRLSERSPSTNDRKLLDKAGPRRSFENDELAPKFSSASKESRDHSTFEDRGRETLEKQSIDGHSRMDMHNNKFSSAVSSSYDRADLHVASHLPLPHPVRHGNASPSFMGPYEDDNNRGKFNSRFRRSGDGGMGRWQAGAWISTPTWASPLANGFPPMAHAPPQTGFQFSAPIFGVRPPLDLNHSGFPYNMHEAADRYPGLVRPFGSRGPVDDLCPPHLQVWDGSNGVFGEESRSFGRNDWDHNRHMMGNRGWEMSSELWKGQNGNINLDFPVPLKDAEYQHHPSADEAQDDQTGNQLRNERMQLDHLPPSGIGGKQRKDVPPPKDIPEMPAKTLLEQTREPLKSPATPHPSKESNNEATRFCCSYLSKLDVSLDLTPLDLYEQYMSIMDSRDLDNNMEVSECFGFQDNNLQYAKEVDLSHCNKEKPVGKSTSAKIIINTLLPKAGDAVFQGAMSLYNKLTEGLKLKATASPPRHAEDSGGSPSQGGGGGLVDADPDFCMNIPATETASAILLPNKEEPAAATATPAVEGVLSEDAVDPSSGLIRDDAVALIGECRVKSNRIPSPESTH